MYPKTQKSKTVNVTQGNFAVSSEADCVMTTILGSCVATCLYDPVANIGGLNHFLLPDGDVAPSERVIYGVHSMELLINGILKGGGRKENLRAKIFGGARMVNGLSDIGLRNAEFGMDFLNRENIPCMAQSLGGTKARRIRFWPHSGVAKQMFVEEVTPEVPKFSFRENQSDLPPKIEDSSGDLELF